MATAESATREQYGHMQHLSVRATRLASDRVRREIIPGLSDKLLAGRLTTTQLLSMHTAYFQAHPLASASFGYCPSPAEGKPELPSTDSPLRTIDISSGENFFHPIYERLHGEEGKIGLADQLTERMNAFVLKAPTMTDPLLQVILYKFHVLFSTAHLPQDGNGRFIGDVDTLLQRTLATRLTRVGRNFEPNYISNTGYRFGHQEQWSMRTEDFSRYFLVLNIIEGFKEQYPNLPLSKEYPLSVMQDPSWLRQQLEDFYADIQQGSPDKLQIYEAFLTDALRGQIDHVLELDSERNWLDQVAAMEIPKRKPGSNEYYFSKDYAEDIETVDMLLGYFKNRTWDMVREVIGNPDLITDQLTNRPWFRGVLIEIVEIIQNGNLNINSLVKYNPNLRKLTDHPGKEKSSRPWWKFLEKYLTKEGNLFQY